MPGTLPDSPTPRPKRLENRKLASKGRRHQQKPGRTGPNLVHGGDVGIRLPQREITQIKRHGNLNKLLKYHVTIGLDYQGGSVLRLMSRVGWAKVVARWCNIRDASI